MGHSLFNLPSDFACFGQQGQKMRYPRRGPSGAVGARTAAQKGYALYQIAVLNLYPAAVVRSDRIPEWETLLGPYRNQLLCPFAKDCIVPDQREQHRTVSQNQSQRWRMSQPPSLSDYCGVLCQCLIGVAEAEKDIPQDRLRVCMGVEAGLMDKQAVRVWIIEGTHRLQMRSG